MSYGLKFYPILTSQFWTYKNQVNSLTHNSVFFILKKYKTKPEILPGVIRTSFDLKLQANILIKSDILKKQINELISPWSVAKQSMNSRLSHNACLSSSVTRLGLTWLFFSPSRSTTFSVRKRWWGATSQVTGRPWHTQTRL